MTTRRSGRITRWKDDQGFGFIRPGDGGNDVFVHISAFVNRNRRPAEEDVVTYRLKTDASRRLRADQVRYAGDRTKQSPPRSRHVRVALILAGGFLVGVGGLATTGRLPPAVLTVYLVASAATFFAYARDKSFARNDGWRTPEKTLHLLGLAGGWPGALIARQVFRHKSRKQPFIAMFWTTVVLNCGLLLWLLSPAGRNLLDLLMGR